MPRQPYSPDLCPPWLFTLLKTGATDIRNAFYYDWRDKRKIETGAVGNTKKCISEEFRGLEKKTLA